MFSTSHKVRKRRTKKTKSSSTTRDADEKAAQTSAKSCDADDGRKDANEEETRKDMGSEKLVAAEVRNALAEIAFPALEPDASSESRRSTARSDSNRGKDESVSAPEDEEVAASLTLKKRCGDATTTTTMQSSGRRSPRSSIVDSKRRSRTPIQFACEEKNKEKRSADADTSPFSIRRTTSAASLAEDATPRDGDDDGDFAPLAKRRKTTTPDVDDLALAISRALISQQPQPQQPALSVGPRRSRSELALVPSSLPFGLDFDFDPDTYARLNPLRRTPGTPIVPTDAKPLHGMVGMDNVANLLCDVIAKPMAATALCETVLARLTSLHFCVIGPSGTGKCVAVRRACSMWNVEMVTIRPHSCRSGDVAAAVFYATRRAPCVVCFEEFDNLTQSSDFRAEFLAQIAGNKAMCEQWNRVWLAFCVEREDTLVRANVVGALCGPRIARWVPPSCEELARLFYDEFLCGTGGVKIDPKPTEMQWNELVRAVEGRTPRDLMVFAGRVLFAVMSKRSIDALTRISGTKSMLLLPSSSPSGAETVDEDGDEFCAGSNLTDIENLIYPSCGRTPTQSVLDSRDAPRIVDRTNERRHQTNNRQCHQQQQQRFGVAAPPTILVSWSDDVVAMYSRTRPDRDGVSKIEIPKYECGFVNFDMP